MKSLWQSVLETSSARAYNIVVGLMVMFVTARALGPEGQGMLSAVISWVGLFAVLGGLSLGHVAQYHIQLRRHEHWLPEILGALLLLTGCLSLIAWLLAALLYAISNGDIFHGIPNTVLLLAFTLLPLLIWEDYSSNLLAAAGKLRNYNVAQFAGRSLWMLGILLLVGWFGLGIKYALFAQVAGQTVVALLTFQTLWHAAGGKKLSVEWGEVRRLVRGASVLHLNTVGSFLLGNTSVLALNHFGNKADVGHYQLAYQMVSVLLVMPQATSLVLFSRIPDTGVDKLWPHQKHVMLQTLAGMTLLAILAYALAPYVIVTLAGERFLPSVEMFRSLLPILLGLSLAQLMTAQWIGRGLFFPTAMVTIMTAAANVAANMWLVPKFGVYGAIWSNIFCYAVLTVLFQTGFAIWCERRYRLHISSHL